jgi:hypothetical protein
MTPLPRSHSSTQGVDGSLIDVGQGPVITPTPTPGVPVPGTLLLGAGLGLVGAKYRNKRV